MEIHFGGLTVSAISEKELIRQFRVLRQTLSMHAMLRDRYFKLALSIDLVLLACGVIFCATTFALDGNFVTGGVGENIRIELFNCLQHLVFSVLLFSDALLQTWVRFAKPVYSFQ